MKKLLPYLLFTLAVPIVLAVVFYLRFISTTNDIDPNMHYLLRPSSERNDILFIGNSHTFYQIDPNIVKNVTGLKAYNLGLEGVGMAYYSMVYHIYMQRHPAPAYLVINVDHRSFDVANRVFNFPDYIPYLRDSMVSASLCPYYPEYRYRLYQLYYSMQRVNSRTDPSKLSNLRRLFTPNLAASVPAIDTMRGFYPSAIQWKDKVHDTKEFHSIYQGPGINMLREIVTDATKRGIKVILISTPQYKDWRTVIRDYDKVMDSARSIASVAHIPVWDYEGIPMTRDSMNYYSIEHLNARGARVYSEILGGDIREYTKPSP